jgi:hypothetical protein
VPDHHPSDDDTEERDIYVHIDLHHGYGDHGRPDHVRIVDLRGPHITVDLDHDDDTIVLVLRALHDRRPALYHGGEPDDDAAACSWCAELAARASGDGVTP